MNTPAQDLAAPSDLRANFRRRWSPWLASAAGALLAAGVGALLIPASHDADAERAPLRRGLDGIRHSFADALRRSSYDLLFVVRGATEVDELCIVYLDEHSARALGQPDGRWDRAVHARLVRRLREEGARAVWFDIVFADPSNDPAVDEDFAAAMREHGAVFLGAALERDEGHGATQERTVPPTPVLRRAARGWGLLAFRPVDADYGVRRLYTGNELVPSAAWRAAAVLRPGFADTPEARAVPRWMNYYGPPDTFPSLSYDRALARDGAPAGFFRDRIVCVGGRSTLSVLQLGKDDFRHPFGIVGAEFAEGVDVHATALLNLLRGDALRRLDARAELALTLAAGLLLGGMLPWLRPTVAALAACAAVAMVAALAYAAFAWRGVWFAWLAPAGVVIPLALVWAIGSRYFIEERRRRALRTAFAHYLSPEMADRIADARFSLERGGRLVEATVLFTDLENYSGIAEELSDPNRVVGLLNEYFASAAGCILEHGGTILKYLGDALEAVWGAGSPDAEHALRAVRAAWSLQAGATRVFHGHLLRTRVGINTGSMLAGNIGSAQRFDYAVIGDAVNFAARLESLNKHFGTSILISDTTEPGAAAEFHCRLLGEVRVVGKKDARRIFEVVGSRAEGAPPPWLAPFALGLEAFRAGDLAVARSQMEQVATLRGEPDGPATFYLRQIASLEQTGLPAGWTGLIEFAEK